MSAGALKRLAVDSELPFDTSSIRMEILDEDVRATRARSYNEGVRGTHSRSGKRTRRNTVDVAGPIVMNPTPAELDWWLPRITGGTKDGNNVITLGETIPEFQLLIDKVGQVHQYTGCKVARAVFSASAGQGLILTVEIVGKDATAPGTVAFPAIDIVDDQPYIYSDSSGALKLDANTHESEQVQIAISNLFNPRRGNSRTVNNFTFLDREVMFGLSTPYTASGNNEVGEYNNQISTDNFIPGEITFTNGAKSIKFAFVHLEQMALQDPGGGAKGEILLPHNYAAYEDGGTKELVITNIISA